MGSVAGGGTVPDASARADTIVLPKIDAPSAPMMWRRFHAFAVIFCDIRPIPSASFAPIFRAAPQPPAVWLGRGGVKGKGAKTNVVEYVLSVAFGEQPQAQGIELDKARRILLVIGSRVILKGHMRFAVKAVGGFAPDDAGIALV